MISFSCLPSDIIYEVAKYLSIRDVCILSHASVDLYFKVKGLQTNIIIYNFKKHNKLYNVSEIENLRSSFYGCIQNHLINHIYNYTMPKYQTYNSENYKQYLLENNMYYRFSTCRFEYFNNIYQLHEKEIDNINNSNLNWYVNLIFSKIFYYFVYNNYYDIKHYPNKFELYALYNFLQIELYQNKTEFVHLLNFLESIDTIKYYKVRLTYYESILDTFHTNPFTITFDQMFKISHTVISIPIFKKLFGVRMLDLSRSKFHQCCLDCNEEILREICEFKFHYPNDDLVSYNYLQFKSLLRKENQYYLAYLENSENYYLNDLIYIKNPCTNRRMRINGNLYKSFIKWISLDDTYYYTKLVRNITKRREYLRQKIFT